MYRATFSEEFKQYFYEALENIEGTIHLIDLFDWSEFTDEDFHDSDHLSRRGAVKTTHILKSQLGL